ncbi:tRNA (adenosine(37)-N6)-threonylcarbamoyltransferase complex dimerization subunit type 1 TsaB [Halomonas piscis]|uniref:tRNA threonylcarbamoyladenosine biosynthesis protein TsaB n=1 Tax=Halomonas piscis TaxID=3031727 RepID=A0ABY9YYX5_9GAMM|nr:tRNA (adenosine(37)-N6)-threonylcarbamoyltransferase complex dimerization subunit type 1 TsaB [Halomonas piscis]WNK19656.1 tRNA (adenosine(37)-N6)-threonylcarbamoyltransferase complex dimerization subunit type 1 TsaB [Halomonas piscis]
MALNLLAMDASSGACSAALLRRDAAGERCLARLAMTPREHTRRLLPMVDEVLAEAGIAPGALDAVAFGRGPGSFTGLRIAAGAAQGLAFGLERPLLGISTLEALALQAHRRFDAGRVATLIDARMGEIYAAFWHCADGATIRRGDEAVLAPAQLTLPDDDEARQWTAVGTGLALRDSLAAAVGARLEPLDTALAPGALEPRAEEMAWLAARDFDAGRGQPAHLAQPVYLRNEVAWKTSA